MKKSFFRKMLVYVTTLTLIAAVFSSLSLNVIAEEPQDPQELPDPEIDEWFIDANGTYFEITNSSYLNIILTSSENVHVYLESISGMVSFFIESNCSANSTLLTFSGFEASKTYYRYQNGNLQEEFTTDTDGSYMYTQDITTHNHVSIKEEISTIYIQSDGSINPSTAPITKDDDYYTLTGNVYEPIYIQKSGITLDGAGFTVQGFGTDHGIYCNKVSGLTIKNLNIIDFSNGIFLYECHNSIIVDNNIASSIYGILMYHSIGNNITSNTISYCTEYGLHMCWGSIYNLIDGNIISGNNNGIYFRYYADNNVISHNIISNTNYGIYSYWSGRNTIKNNTISDSYVGIYGHEQFASNSIAYNTFFSNIYSIYLFFYHTGWYHPGHNTIKNNTISDSYVGIHIERHIHNNMVSGNIIFNNEYGLVIKNWGNYNTVICNIISNNYYGIYLTCAWDNIFYYNNIIDNTYQFIGSAVWNTWDNGAGEGNYWSDYTGLDDGSNGRIAGDGIGDTNIPHPYVNQGNGYNQIDNYPLMTPWSLNDPPIADAGGPYEVDEGTEITFNASDSSDPDGDELQYRWDFNDDGTWDTSYSTDPTAVYTWYEQYTGTVAVEVYDGDLTDIATDSVTVNDLNPTAAFTWSPEPQDEGYPVQFTDQSLSYDGIISWSWDFAGLGVSTGQNPTFTFMDDGTYDVCLTVTEDDSDTDTVCHTVTILDLAAVAAFTWSPEPQDEGSPVQFTDESTSYPDDIVSWSWDFDGWGTSTNPNPSFTFLDNGVYTVALTVTDDDGSTSTMSYDITVLNVAPIADAGEDKTGYEPSTFTFTGSHTDSGTLDTHTYEWDFNYDGTFDVEATGTIVSHIWEDDFNGIVALRVTDDDGGWDIDTCSVTINNVDPTITSLNLPIDPLEIGTAIDLSASFTDLGVLDTHTASINWGDGNVSSGTITGSGGSYTVTDSWTYGQAGVYTITLTIEDDDGGSATEIFQYVVVYNPSGGFVTGGGWINSPEGAYTPDPTLTGKANFGFVSRYTKGQSIPYGNTRFKFKLANMNFYSNDYDWLVIANAKAMYKGTGTINGDGNYGFMLSAIDEEITPSTDVDLFRIKIWDKDDNDNVIYDNKLGAEDDSDPTTAIGGGQIKIHGN